MIESLDPKIVSMINAETSAMRNQSTLNQYWVQRAITVLNGYANCPVPLSRDKRTKTFHRDILSEKGHQCLHILEQAYKAKHYTRRLEKLAQQAAQKALLDLSLFIDFDYLQPIVLSDVPYAAPNSKNFQVSMTTGCYNGCVHCGFDAKAPVAHMPYPIFLKLF